MSKRILNGLAYLAFFALVGLAAWRLVISKPAPGKSNKPDPPAKVEKPVKEDQLNTVTLSEEAESRLGVAVGSVESKKLRRSRVYGGEVVIPAGRTVIVSAPLNGTLKAPADGMPKAGQRVKKGQEIVGLLPLLTPEGRTTTATALVESDGQVANAKTALEAAKVALDRAKRLFEGQAGSRRLVDESQALFDIAEKTLGAAEARRDLLKKIVGEGDRGYAAPIRVESPEDGILRTVSALPDQSVPAGAALFEVVDPSKVWVRVGLPVGDLDEIDRAALAQIGRPNTKPTTAPPATAPPSANALNGTIDLFYVLDNPNYSLTPGQRVPATLDLSDAEDSLAVPASSVIYDVYGNAWVYQVLKPHAYARRRVAVRSVGAEFAALSQGPPAGTPVVTSGAQELFAAETGFIK